MFGQNYVIDTRKLPYPLYLHLCFLEVKTKHKEGSSDQENLLFYFKGNYDILTLELFFILNTISRFHEITFIFLKGTSIPGTNKDQNCWTPDHTYQQIADQHYSCNAVLLLVKSTG